MEEEQIPKMLARSMFLWKTMRRKCKHCKNYNTYRYRWFDPDNKEVHRLARALGASMEAFTRVLMGED